MTTSGLRFDSQLQECQNAHWKRSFPDLDYALFGYDILNGYPLATGHDPALRTQYSWQTILLKSRPLTVVTVFQQAWLLCLMCRVKLLSPPRLYETDWRCHSPLRQPRMLKVLVLVIYSKSPRKILWMILQSAMALMRCGYLYYM